MLTGSEVKALRTGQCNITEAYASVEGGELWLINAHISALKEAIEAYDWPGNVRELESRVKRATIMADNGFITREDLELAPHTQPRPLNLKQIREEAERRAIRRALTHCDNNISDAASALGVTRPTLYNMMEKYQLKP